MASVEQENVSRAQESKVEIKPDELVNTVAKEDASLAVRRYFTIPGRDPFDEIEWEQARRVHPRQGAPGVRPEGRRVPQVLVADRDEHRRAEVLPRPHDLARARELGAPDDRPGRRRPPARGAARAATSRPRTRRETFEDELKAILVNQLAAFNSPVWFNVGFEERPQCSACFILSIEDSMDSILDWIRREGVIFRGGSGSGVNLSRLRSSKEQLSKGGHASGPVSFMRGADASAGTIKSGGKTRRAAKMVVLDVDHPDILEFVWCKAREEEKARVLEAAGYDMSLDSPDWSSIQYQNANNSVRVSDSFMAGGRGRRRLEPDRPRRRLGRRDDEGARPAPPDRRRRVALRRPGRAVRHDDQPAGTRSRTRGASTRRTRAPSTCRSTTRRATSPR